MFTNDAAEIKSEKARGAFDLRGGEKRDKPIKLYLMIGLIVLFALCIFIGIWAMVLDKISVSSTSSEELDESTVMADPTLAIKSSEDSSMVNFQANKRKEWEEEEKAKPAEEPVASVEPPPPLNGRTPSAPARAPQSPAQNAPAVSSSLQRKLGQGLEMMGFSPGESQSQSRAAPAPFIPGSGTASSSFGADGASRSRGSLDDLSGPVFTAAKAVLSPPGKYLLRHNTYARCALYTEIQTEQPGLVDCRLTDPIYSADGSTVIAEAGARLDGVQRVQMSAGQTNVFTTWTELETTAGVRAQINSLGAGPLGASGTKAWIDNHWKERFGGALMLTVFQDGFGALAASASAKNNSGYSMTNTEQNVESMAEKALESSINISPTGYVLPGTVLTIIVARDVDFSQVYENR